MRRRVFLSHSAKDIDLARQLVHSLTNVGLDVFSSSPAYGIPSGENFSQHIRRKIQEANAVLVIISPNSLASKWVQFELGAAWGMGKRVVPILTQGTSFEDLPPTISSFQAFQVNTRDELLKAVELISDSFED